jgi:hypothetical protein
MNSEGAPSVPNNLLEGLGKLGSAIVGLSAFAYVAGFVKLIAVYGALKANWIIEFVVTQDILRAGLEPMAMVGATGAATAYIFWSRGWVFLKILSFLAVSAMIIYIQTIPSTGFDENWYDDYRFSRAISYYLYLVTGMLGAYSVFEIAVVKSFSVKAIAGFLLAAVFALYITPTYLGKTWAHSVVSGKNILAKVVGDQYKGESCFLLGNVNSKYLIGCLVAGNMERFQMIEVDKEVAFLR